ncbi:MAG: trypsin-like serine protease [Candidatus Limnocylindria bacterium]
MRRRFIGLLGSAALILATSSPALAIVYGEIDSDNTYANTGALIAQFDEGKFVICSGTLISSTVFLTAAHCVRDGATMWVSFDQAIEEPVTETTNTIHSGTAHAHPNFACCGANDTFDIAVVVLNAPVGIEPADLPELDALGQMSNQELRSAEFVAAGYGTVRETKKGAFQPLFWDPQRRFAEQSVYSLTKAWLTLSMNQATGDGGTCYGDSGGPHFLGDTVMSITVTGDVWCKATDKTYRVDTPVARDFLADFVTLP